MAAPAAHAIQLKAAEYPATLDGTSVEGESTIFTFEEREFLCKKTTLGATLEQASSTFRITREYTECEMNKTFPATVTVNGCVFTLHLNSMTDKDNFGASVDIECEGPSGIQFYAYQKGEKHEPENALCAYEIYPQEGIKSVLFKNMTLAKPALNDVTVQPQIKQEMVYERLHGMKLFCGEEFGLASYTGNTTVTATKGGAQVALEVVE
jgi:hypothetical protein